MADTSYKSVLHSFPKSERLCSRKAIDALFTSGNRAFSAFPLRVIYKRLTEEDPDVWVPQILVSVSKRHFKHAVDRNRTKRQIREAWRLNKDILQNAEHVVASTPSTANLHIAFIWLSDELQPSELVHRKMKNLLHRIHEDLCSASYSSSPSASTSDSSAP